MSTGSQGGREIDTFDEGTTVSFSTLPEGDGLVVRDAVMQRQCKLLADSFLNPKPERKPVFDVPIDTATSVTVSRLSITQLSSTFVWTSEGEIFEELHQQNEISVPEGVYDIEFDGPLKMYIRLRGPCHIETSSMFDEVNFKEPTEVTIGARSHHSQPAGTITTTENPQDIMQAVSALSSALKTTSPERSFPTLRGHPPAIELSDNLTIPEHLNTSETGIQIELPKTHEAVYTASPLAYYLGADVVPGRRPQIVTDQGFEYHLGPDFEDAVERALRQTFFLDCLVRTEGRYQVNLHERKQVAANLEIDLGELYDQSPAERLSSYLGVNFDSISDQIPKWKLTAHVTPDAGNVETLPFLIDDLAIIRTPEKTHNKKPVSGEDNNNHSAPDEFVRSASASTNTGPSLVQPATTETLEQSWVGENAPVGANKVVPEAFKNRINTEPTDGNINITVICNDENMLAEHEDVQDIYDSCDFPSSITVHENLTTDRLKLVLESEIDFLHYIGHIEPGGFRCPDGLLDAGELQSVGLSSFFLNACQSYEQGRALIKRGAIAGVVTLDDIINSGAIRVGTAMARLLNSGFPFGGALDIASEESIIGSQYLVVGDATTEVTQCKGGIPVLLNISSRDDEYDITLQSYPTRSHKMGSMVHPQYTESNECFLVSGEFKYSCDARHLQKALSNISEPVRYEGNLMWDCDRFD
jgi:hypothetical protein